MFPDRPFCVWLQIIVKSRVVKTNAVAKQLWMRRMAVCICDAATGRRMGSGMLIGHWSSRIERGVVRVSVSLLILESWINKAGLVSSEHRNLTPRRKPTFLIGRPVEDGSRLTCAECGWSVAVHLAVVGWG